MAPRAPKVTIDSQSPKVTIDSQGPKVTIDSQGPKYTETCSCTFVNTRVVHYNADSHPTAAPPSRGACHQVSSFFMLSITSWLSLLPFSKCVLITHRLKFVCIKNKNGIHARNNCKSSVCPKWQRTVQVSPTIDLSSECCNRSESSHSTTSSGGSFLLQTGWL